MSTTITLSSEYGYVAGALLSTFYLNLYQVLQVSKWRKASKIEYPQVYAEKAEAASSQSAYKFNCAQRAHANTLESLPAILSSTVILSVKYPLAAAAACGAWTAFRFAYTVGYLEGPKNRNIFFAGSVSSVLTIGLLIGATVSAAQIALA